MDQALLNDLEEEPNQALEVDSEEQSSDQSPSILPAVFRNPFRTVVLECITGIFASLHNDSLQQNKPLSFTLKNRKNPDSSTPYSFPGRTPAEAWRFTTVLKIIDVIYDLVYWDRSTTKRDIFYKYASLFKSQSVVDKTVDDLAATFGVERSALNVVAQKGLVSGNIQLHLSNNAILDCRESESGVLIPPVREIATVELNESLWILVVEKEAVFRALSSDLGFVSSSRGILVTGKGYPDVSTRQFLHLVSETTEVPIFALVDLDPHGIEIMTTYKFGSNALAHEAEGLVVRRMEWLGVKCHDVARLITEGVVDAESRETEGLQFLTPGDRAKASRLLQRNYVPDMPQLRTELQRMLFTGVKAEIELLDCLKQKSMFSWLEEKISAIT